MANIERHIWLYAVTDMLNREQRCGFPSGRTFFLNDVSSVGASADQANRLAAAFDRYVAATNWRATCEGYGANALNPRDGTAAIPRMLNLYASQSFLSLMYDVSTHLSTEFRNRLRAEGVLGPRE
jgi:hypothetical protein